MTMRVRVQLGGPESTWQWKTSGTTDRPQSQRLRHAPETCSGESGWSVGNPTTERLVKISLGAISAGSAEQSYKFNENSQKKS